MQSNMNFNLVRQAGKILDKITKLKSSLGDLEKAYVTVCKVLGSLNPVISKPCLVIPCCRHNTVYNHRITNSDINVTQQMRDLFLRNNGAGVILALENGAKPLIVDLGFDGDFVDGYSVIPPQYQSMFEMGKQRAYDLFKEGCNTIILGEMGVGNSSYAAALFSFISALKPEECVMQLSDADIRESRIVAITKAISNYTAEIKQQNEQTGENKDIRSDVNLFRGICKFAAKENIFGAGIIKGAADKGMMVLLDGFISSASALISNTLFPETKSSLVASHFTGDPAHARMLDFLGLEPLFSLNIHAGEGAGAAAVLPLIRGALKVATSLESFKNSGVSSKKNDTSLVFPFGATSCLGDDSLIKNVEYLCDKVDDIELIFFETESKTNFPTPDELLYLRHMAYKHEITYTVHLPYTVKLGSANEDERTAGVNTVLKFINRIGDSTLSLPVFGYILHLEADNYSLQRPFNDEKKWAEQIKKSLKEINDGLPESFDRSLICIETLNYDLLPYLELILSFNFRLALDIGHLWNSGVYSKKIIKTLLNHTRIIHLHGVDVENIDIMGRDHKSLSVMDTKVLFSFLDCLYEYYLTNMVITLELFDKNDLDESLKLLRESGYLDE